MKQLKSGKPLFCVVFNEIVSFFNIIPKTICDLSNGNFSESSVSSWRTRNAPGSEFGLRILKESIKKYFEEHHIADYANKNDYKKRLTEVIGQYCSVPKFLICENEYPITELVTITLDFAFAKKYIMPYTSYPETNRTQKPAALFSKGRKTEAIVFDFDGTLTTTNMVRTTWESIWILLGYDVQNCVDLHMKFSRGEISHEEWCDLTAEKFMERKLHRNQLDPLIKNIKLIEGIEEVFKELDRRDIKLYIVSGSIKYIIRRCLGELTQYVSGGINANVFDFDETGYLIQIIGTEYDFEGKATRISKIAEELKIDPNKILFVGNSLNDEWAHKSGARTLAINPRNTNMFNSDIWDDCIVHCNSLIEIMKYV